MPGVWRKGGEASILFRPLRGLGEALLTGRRFRLASSFLAVAFAAGCAPGSNPASAAPSGASSAPGPTSPSSPSMNLQLARAVTSPATTTASFLSLPDPDGGARSRARLTALPGGAALVTGGLTAKGATNQVLIFDPLTATFVTLKGATLEDARYDHEATLLGTSASGVASVLVTGGYDDHSQLASVELVQVDLKNFAATTTIHLTPLPEPRSNHQAVLTSRGVLIVGGCVPRPGRDAVPAASSLIYTLTTDGGRVTGGQPVVTASQPRVARFGHQALLLGGADERVLVFGGTGADADAVSTDAKIGPLASAEVYEPSVERWSTVRFDESATPAPRTNHRLVRAADGGALLVGPGRLVEEIALDARDASLGTLVPGASLARTRAGAEVATLDDGRFLVAGGFDPATGLARDDAEILAANGQSIEPPVSIGTGRFEHGVASVGADRVLVFGGRAARDVFGSPTSGLLLLKK